MPEKELDQQQCHECAIEVRIGALEEGLKKVNAEHKEFYDRLRAIEIGDAIRSERYETILEKMDGLTEAVDALTSAPGKKWESLMDKIFFTVVGAVVAFLLTQIGL